MHLSREKIREYQEVYKREFGKEITESEAAEQAGRVVRLFAMLLEDSFTSPSEGAGLDFDRSDPPPLL